MSGQFEDTKDPHDPEDLHQPTGGLQLVPCYSRLVEEKGSVERNHGGEVNAVQDTPVDGERFNNFVVD